MTDRKGSLADKVAVITGAARGIGRGIAEAMANQGAHIVLADIDEDGLRETQAVLQASGARAIVAPTDVSCSDQNRSLVETTLKGFGRIDVLVNNAGINVDEGVLRVTQDGLRSVMRTNFEGPVLLTVSVANEMIVRRTKGTILFTSSVHGRIVQMHPAYSCSKAAIEMFVREAAIELAPHGIRVNAVAPGGIAVRGETDLSHPDVPLGCRGRPKDIADMMTFLASESGNYITGQTITVDGGFSLQGVWPLRMQGRLQ
jgi:NAD(P)-dependent dehydrogenase (short-subunit alcohol dehydrogenase family)